MRFWCFIIKPGRETDGDAEGAFLGYYLLLDIISLTPSFSSWAAGV